MELPEPESMWMEDTEKTDFPRLEEHISADVAIVGGGISGLTIAYMLDRRGYSVAVLEADRLVRGITGHTTAKITSLHHLKYDYLSKNFGDEMARIYGESNQQAIKTIADIIERENIDCGFTYAPMYVYTQQEKKAPKIKREIRAAKKLGLPASLETTVPMPFDIEAAVKFEDQAYFHPRKYLLGLADSLSDSIEIFEKTPVQELEGSNVVTEDGRVKAEHLVLASHFPFDDNGFYFARQFPHYSYAVAVEVENAPEVMTSGLEKKPFHTYRPNDNLAVIAGKGHKTGQGGETRQRYEKLVESGEVLDAKSVKYLWSTQDYSTIDRIPYIGRRNPFSENVYVATGYDGWGMTSGTVAGQLLTDLIDGEENEWRKLYNPNRIPPSKAAGEFFKENLNAAKVMLNDWIRTREDDPLSLEKGEAQVLKVNGDKVAAYRDKKGELHTVSAVCNHMGCIVRWNDAERTWDCPCHGSRFNYDGKVIHGPAKKDLDEKELP